MPRSGTTLVEQIFSSHPQVYGAGELNHIADLTRSAPSIIGAQKKYPECLKYVKEADFDFLAEEYINKVTILAPSAIRITDKMPHNFMHLGLIRILFPDAFIIHVRRNPLDTYLSYYFQYFATGHDYSSNLVTLGNHYQHYQQLMAFWKNSLNIQMLEIDHETLVDHPEEISMKIIAYCELPWNEGCLSFHKTGKSARTASYAQVRQPIYSSSINRWKNYEKFLGPLTKALNQGAEHLA